MPTTLPEIKLDFFFYYYRILEGKQVDKLFDGRGSSSPLGYLRAYTNIKRGNFDIRS